MAQYNETPDERTYRELLTTLLYRGSTVRTTATHVQKDIVRLLDMEYVEKAMEEGIRGGDMSHLTHASKCRQKWSQIVTSHRQFRPSLGCFGHAWGCALP